MSWATLIFFIGILVALSLSRDTRVALFAAPVWILFMIITYRCLRGTRATADPIDWNTERVKARQTLDEERACAQAGEFAESPVSPDTDGGAKEGSQR